MMKRARGDSPGDVKCGCHGGFKTMTIKDESQEYINYLKDEWEAFFKKYCEKAITDLSNQYPEKKSLIVKFGDLDNYNLNLSEELLKDPDMTLELATAALTEFDSPSGVIFDKGVNVCIINIPAKKRIKEIRSKDIGRLISIEGIVTKATEVRPKIVEAAYECPFCRHIFHIEQNERGFTEPIKCPEEEGGCGRKAQRFIPLHNKSTFVNAQIIKLQDLPEELKGGELPQTLVINLEDDLTDKIYPGNQVNVVGVLRSQQRITQYAKTRFFDIYVDANSVQNRDTGFEEVEIKPEDEREIKELSRHPNLYAKLVRSIAPSVYGYEEIKEAMVLQLFKGVSKELPDRRIIRGNIHILIIGDPGTAKSILIIYVVSELALRGFYAVGSSSSGVGLTAATVRDPEFGGDKWTVDAGTLVLADKGIAAVDEFEKLKEGDRDKLHEALEQQSVTISKAGLNMRLNARTALLAAANPKYGRFDKHAPLAEQIDISPALLSRFDLIFTMMDRPNEEADSKTAEHIIHTHKAGELLARHEEDTEGVIKNLQPDIDSQLFRKYITYARKIIPKLSPDAEDKFKDFYIGLRRQGYEDEDAPVPVTARQLEALIRLGEAKARTRLSNEITAEDAECVINLVTYCLKRVCVDPETGKLDVDWITVGTTKTRRDRAKAIEGVIKDLGKEYGDGVPIEEILDLVEEQGIEREKAEETIERMKRDGILISLKGGIKFHA